MSFIQCDSALHKTIILAIENNPRIQNEHTRSIISLQHPVFQHINSKTKFDICSNIELSLTRDVCELLSTTDENINFYCVFDMRNMVLRCNYASSKPRRSVFVEQQFALSYSNFDLEGSAKAQKHNKACAQLIIIYGRLAYKLMHEIPAIKSSLRSVIAREDPISDDTQQTKEDLDKQINEVLHSCLLLLLDEEEQLKDVESDAAKRVGGQFFEIPTITSVDQIDEHKNKVDKLQIDTDAVDALRTSYEETKEELKKSKGYCQSSRMITSKDVSKILIFSQDNRQRSRNLRTTDSEVDSDGYIYISSKWNDKLYMAYLDLEDYTTNNRVFHFILESSHNTPAIIRLDTYTDMICFERRASHTSSSMVYPNGDSVCNIEFKLFNDNKLFMNMSPIKPIHIDRSTILNFKKIKATKSPFDCIGFVAIIPEKLMLGKYGRIISYNRYSDTFTIDIQLKFKNDLSNTYFEQIQCTSQEIKMKEPFTTELPNIFCHNKGSIIHRLNILDDELLRIIRKYSKKVQKFSNASKKFESTMNESRQQFIRLLSNRKKKRRGGGEDQLMVPEKWAG
jgi:hypothetical protein